MSQELWITLGKAVAAGVFASLACGLGALPLVFRRLDPAKHTGLGYAIAGGLMFAASVYNLILPALQGGQEDGWKLGQVSWILLGMLLGSGFLALADSKLPHEAPIGQPERFKAWGGRVGLLVFLAMTVHSIPEGVAVGVGYTSDVVPDATTTGLGPKLALAIAIHNIPEGLAVAIPLRSAGASMSRCFWAAVVTSLPQPIAAIPAVVLSFLFEPIMPLLMAFAAGAMIFLILLELIPQALETERASKIAWGFVGGFCLMLLIQVVL